MQYQFAALSVVASLASLAVQAAPGYRVEMLPDTTGGTAFNAVAINNRGEVLGYGENDLTSRSFIYSKGSFTFLPQDGSRSLPVDINNHGQALYNSVTGDGYTQPFLYGGGGSINISPGVNASGLGRALSSSGYAVGSFSDRNFFYDGKTSRYLDIDLDGVRTVFATGINSSGTIVGQATVSVEATRAFIYKNGRASFLDGMLDAYAINDFGQILGQDQQGYLVRDGDGSNTYLGFTAYTQLNQRGWVAGNSLVDGALHAFVYREGHSTDLNRLLVGPDADRWSLMDGVDINDRGQIIGIGLFDGQRASFIATPVPESGTWTLMLCGLGVLGAAAQCQRSRGSVKHSTTT
ncbi:hypothetical protein [Azohydromonas australica]|uniref:hypothetical protein n=1 Tax=Azohydromonas australica TaxID=364039 RepID=UPI00146E0DF1|nr:hypothetical protein [Azohydromonas australica]